MVSNNFGTLHLFCPLNGVFLYAKQTLPAAINKAKANHEKEQAHLKYVHELELKTKKEIIQLKNDKLETEVVYKTKSLFLPLCTYTSEAVYWEKLRKTYQRG